MPRTSHLAAAVATAGLATAAAPGAASAATVALDHACYLQGGGASQPISTSVAGLSAGQGVTVQLSRKGQSAGSAFGTADAAGNLVQPINSWFLSLGSGPKKEVAGQVDVLDATGASVATAPVSLANAGIDVTRSGKSWTWKVQGLTALTGKKVYYAHYFNHNKYKGRLKLGKASGNCGYLKAKRPLTPFRKIGRYDVKVQSSKKYEAGAPFLDGRVVVTKRYL